MVIGGSWNGRPITLSVKRSCLTISIEKEQHTDVFSYDGEGRLWTAMLEGVSYRRGLHGEMVAKWHTGNGERDRRRLAFRNALEVQEQARKSVARLRTALQSGEATLATRLDDGAAQALGRAIAFDVHRAQADVAAYARVYRPVGILPPDQYMAVVLQATEGCAFNTCTFCTFYRDRTFRIKTPAHFHSHAVAVRDFLGAGLSLRRTIFLGDANALIVPMPRLLPLLDVVHDVFDVTALGGMYAFLDGFSGEKKSAADYEALAQRGLERVYIGLESGNAELLRFLRKPGQPADAVEAVRAMKAGGVAVGVIVLLGASGHTFSRQHVADTIQTINAMPLDADDIVYFSDLVVGADMAYARDARQARLRPLTAAERLAQGQAIERALKFSADRGIPHISRYDIREFVY